MALSDTGLLVRYYFDDAASGSSPTSVADAGPNNYPLADLNYGSGNLAFSEVAAGKRGLTSTSNTGTQRANHQIGSSGDAVRTAVSGATALTWELVANYTSGSGSTGRLAAIQARTSGASPAFGLTVVGSTLTPYINTDSGAATANLSASGRKVIHLVFDSTQADAGNRLKLYVDKVLTSNSGSGISLNEAISISGDHDIVHFNRNSGGSYDRSVTGTLHYSALYSGAFDATRVDDHFDVLTLADDTPGASGQTLNPPLVTRSRAIYSPTVTGGALTVSPPLVTRARSIYAPTLTGGAETIEITGLDFTYETQSSGNNYSLKQDAAPPRGNCTIMWYEYRLTQTTYSGGVILCPEMGGSFNGGRDVSMYVTHGCPGTFDSTGQRDTPPPYTPMYHEIAGMSSASFGNGKDYIASNSTLVLSGETQESYLSMDGEWIPRVARIKTVSTTVEHANYVDWRDKTQVIRQNLATSDLDFPSDARCYIGAPPWITNGDENYRSKFFLVKQYSRALDDAEIDAEFANFTNTPIADDCWFSNVFPALSGTTLPDLKGFGTAHDFELVDGDTPGSFTEDFTPQFSPPASQDLAVPLVTRSRTVYSPTLTVGSVTLSPPLVTRSRTVYAPTVAPGSVTINPPLTTRARSLYAPTVTTGSITISPTLVTRARSIFAPTVAPGAASLLPTLVTRSKSIYAPTVSQGSVVLLPPLVTRAKTLHTPTVSTGPVSVFPPLLTRSKDVFAPTVSLGGVVLDLPLVTRVRSLYSPAITVGPVTVSPPLLTRAKVLYSPVVVADGTIAMPLVTRAKAVFEPTVTPGAVNVLPPLVSRARAIFAPAVSQPSEQILAPGLVTRNKVIHPPTVSDTPIVVEVEEAFIAKPAPRNWTAYGSSRF